jgi:hypothetical protein
MNENLYNYWYYYFVMIGAVWKSSSDRKAREEALKNKT